MSCSIKFIRPKGWSQGLTQDSLLAEANPVYNNIVLLTASVEHLQKLISLCYSEFNSIGLDINVAKCTATRVGPRFKNTCVDIVINDKVLPWVHEIKYLGLTYSDGLCLEVNVHPNKINCFIP